MAQPIRDAIATQLKEEIGDTENLPDATVRLLRQKFGTNPPQLTRLEKYWLNQETAGNI